MSTIAAVISVTDARTYKRSIEVCRFSHGTTPSVFPRSREARAALRGSHRLICHTLTAGQLHNLQEVLGVTRPGLCLREKTPQWLQGPFRSD